MSSTNQEQETVAELVQELKEQYKFNNIIQQELIKQLEKNIRLLEEKLEGRIEISGKPIYFKLPKLFREGEEGQL
jgi:hypothetical protein